MNGEKPREATLKKLITHDHSDDGIDCRGFLHCMAWAGTGVIWTITSGIPSSRGVVDAGERSAIIAYLKQISGK